MPTKLKKKKTARKFIYSLKGKYNLFQIKYFIKPRGYTLYSNEKNIHLRRDCTRKTDIHLRPFGHLHFCLDIEHLVQTFQNVLQEG